MQSKTSPDGPQIVKFASLPTPEDQHYLTGGLDQPGGKLPLFDLDGRPVHPSLMGSCLAKGWTEPWFANPLKPDWLVLQIDEQRPARADRLSRSLGQECRVALVNISTYKSA